MIRHAIVRPPGATFAEGLTTVDRGAPVLERAIEQHHKYCEALQACGVSLVRLDADPRHPDSTFVEDTAVLTGRGAILARPGAASRKGEVDSVGRALAPFFPVIRAIAPPGTVDGGDICEAGRRFFIGVSRRTNEDGARQLAAFLEQDGHETSFVDIRGIAGILHLKSGVAYLGDDRLVLIEPLAGHAAFRGYEVLRVEPAENYAANCLRVNESILLPAGYPVLEAALRRLGASLITLDMAEFRKMDGGLSCLSLRF